MPAALSCVRPECKRMAFSLAEMSARSTHLPLRSDPICWLGELDMRAPNAESLFKEVTSTPFSAVALHEHSGSFRNAWAALGFRAASVADRPSCTHASQPVALPTSSRMSGNGTPPTHGPYLSPLPTQTATSPPSPSSTPQRSAGYIILGMAAWLTPSPTPCGFCTRAPKWPSSSPLRCSSTFWASPQCARLWPPSASQGGITGCGGLCTCLRLSPTAAPR